MDTLTVAINTSGQTPTPVKTVTAFTQESPGVWQSAPLQLGSHGYFGYSATATDAAGTATATATSGYFIYDTSPVFHDLTGSPALLSYGHELVTVSGHLTTYDPDLGVTSAPYAGADMGFAGNAFWSQPDGSFSDTLYIGRPATSTFTTTVDANGKDNAEIVSSPVSWQVGADQQTRIVLDSSSASGLVVGTTLKIRGLVQFQDTDGSWKPLTDYAVQLGNSGFTPDASATTDANGRFELWTTVPKAAGNLGLYLPNTYASDRWLVPSTATFQVQSVLQSIGLYASNASVDEFSDLSFNYAVTSTDGKVPGGRIYVLESPNGSTGWKNLGYLQVNGPGSPAKPITAWVDNPHGYWKLWYPGATGYAPAYSGVIHTFRYLTDITGGKPNTTSAYRGQTLRFSGGLWEQGMGNWFRMGANWRVYLFFEPAGSKTWKLVSYTRTDRNGYWNLSGKATAAGTWEVAWFTGDTNHVDAFGPRTYVHIR
ncbi:hypothetical protein [Streptacidiphilus anmyonensis]|uniref:hypothetical protein n=1 Tax=Streptacidiphilus anmyonensis TaxID=405782 RepID=UPI0005A60EAF|nr:hypothetical protein [Streptacidiphilus anmyonensis]